MRLFVLAAALALVGSGCTYTRPLGDVPRQPAPATVVLDDGEMAPAVALHVAPDVVTWVDPRDGAVRSASAGEVVEVRLSNRRRGARHGAAVGAAAGLVLGTGVGALWAFGQDGLGGDANGGATAGAVVGMAAGAGLGTLLGRNVAGTTYR